MCDALSLFLSILGSRYSLYRMDFFVCSDHGVFSASESACSACDLRAVRVCSKHRLVGLVKAMKDHEGCRATKEEGWDRVDLMQRVADGT